MQNGIETGPTPFGMVIPSGLPRFVNHPDRIDIFLQHAAAQPDHPALSSDDGDVSYAQLETRVRVFAAHIAHLSAPKVLIALPQGLDAYAAMLATGLAGGCYSPLNLAAPILKLHAIATALQPDIVIGDYATATDIVGESSPAIILDPATLSADVSFVGRGIRHETAYIIFTSGTTGVPKGVMIGRRSLDHYVAWLRDHLDLVSTDRVSQYPNIAFDLSVMDIYGALCSGATLCPLVRRGDRLLPGRAIERERITVWISVPSVVGLMMQAGDVTADNLHSVRRYVFCGEPLLREHVAALFEACPNAVVQNTYGPTEATVSMTSLMLRASDFHRFCTTSMALGEPIAGMQTLLVGGRHNDEGELVIVGPQLAQGYWQDPSRTAQQFPTMLVDGQMMRVYMTGDWVERRGGQIYFKERIDFQVKICGYRIELDEVAAAIRRCGWPSACVFKHRDALVAVVEHAGHSPFNERALRDQLALQVEAHMIPASIWPIDCLPRSENDKIDRNQARQWFEAQQPAHC